jgi:hypothetical protein
VTSVNVLFQKDSHFPLVAFDHEQIKQCSTGGYLLAESSKFDDIAQRLMDLDFNILNHITKNMENGDQVKSKSNHEKQHFQLIKDLDHVCRYVKGSLTIIHQC